MEIIKYGAGVYTISNFLSGFECSQCIDYAERKGFGEAEITTSEGPIIFKDIRNNDRIIFDNDALAANYFGRAKQHLPQEIDGWILKGLNERFRFYRYENGQYFKWHKDGSFVRNELECSMLTFMIYLNDGYTGGETSFRWDKIKPVTGTALVFPHSLMHQGNSVISGIKYVLRTDVMYCASA